MSNELTDDILPESSAARWAHRLALIPLAGIACYVVLGFLALVAIGQRGMSGFNLLSQGLVRLARINLLPLGIYFGCYLAGYSGYNQEIYQNYYSWLPKHGNHVRYYTSEQDSQALKTEQEYEFGVRTGHFRAWYPGNILKEEGLIINGQKNGVWTYWSEDGKKWQEISYKKNVKHGKTTVWNPSGTKDIEGEYLNGREEGLWASWYENGTKAEEGILVNDEKNGHWIVWHTNGMKNEEGDYCDGQKTGKWTVWYSNGRKSEEGEYKQNAKEGPWLFWYSNGNMAAEGTFSLDSKDGRWILRHENGKIAKIGRFKNDREEGNWTMFHENGQKSGEGAYRNGLLIGNWTFWFNNGKKASEGWFVDAQQMRWVDENTEGVKISEDFEDYQDDASETYASDQYLPHEGPWTYWHSTGKIRMEGNYLSNNKVGAWTYWSEYGTILQKETFDDYGNLDTVECFETKDSPATAASRDKTASTAK